MHPSLVLDMLQVLSYSLSSTPFHIGAMIVSETIAGLNISLGDSYVGQSLRDETSKDTTSPLWKGFSHHPSRPHTLCFRTVPKRPPLTRFISNFLALSWYVITFHERTGISGPETENMLGRRCWHSDRSRISKHQSVISFVITYDTHSHAHTYIIHHHHYQHLFFLSLPPGEPQAGAIHMARKK